MTDAKREGDKKVPEDIDYDEGIQWSSPMTLHERTVYLVHQFLAECGYERTLATLLEEERAVRRRPQLIPRGGELLALVQEHEDLEAASMAAQRPQGPPPCPVLAEPPARGFPGPSAPESTPVLRGAHRGNVLCVRVAPATVPGATVLVTAAADRSVVCTRIVHGDKGGEVKEEQPLWRVDVKSPVLDVACCAANGLLAVATMDGHCWVLEAATGAVVQTLRAHAKYVVAAVWATPDAFATSSRDHTVCVWARPPHSTEPFALHQTLDFPANVECLCVEHFGSSSSLDKEDDKDKDKERAEEDKDGDQDEAVILACVRDDCWVHRLVVGRGRVRDERYFNVNGGDDEHVSFAVLALTRDPAHGRLLCASTDRDRLAVYDLGAGGRLVRTLYGAPNDEMSQPRHCWLAGSEHVASTALDGCVYVWELRSQRVVARLRGHTRVVRDVAFDPANNTIFSASFDGTIRLWPSTVPLP